MSEQIQSLLNEMENKFDESFSESLHEQPISKQLNPESAKKTQSKPQHHKMQSDSKSDDFDQMKNSLLEQLNQHQDSYPHEDINEHQIGQQHQSKVNEHLHIKSATKKRQNTPNFKYKEEHEYQDLQELKKAASQQHFSKVSYETCQPNQDNPFYYKELTMKLQKALMKISSDKVVGPVRKSYGFYDRVEQFEQKKKRQIQRKKQQLQDKQINSVQDRPLINSHSRALVAQVSNDPIYIRCDKIIERRKEKEQQNQRIKDQRQQKQYQAFKQQFDSYMDEIKQKYQGKTLRSPEEYYHEQQTWIKTKEKNIQSRLNQQNQKIKSEVTFKPLINSKSQKIIKNKKDDQRVPIFDREPKQKEHAKDPNCTFKPKINKSNFYKKITYYQAPF